MESVFSIFFNVIQVIPWSSLIYFVKRLRKAPVLPVAEAGWLHMSIRFLGCSTPIFVHSCLATRNCSHELTIINIYLIYFDPAGSTGRAAKSRSAMLVPKLKFPLSRPHVAHCQGANSWRWRQWTFRGPTWPTDETLGSWAAGWTLLKLRKVLQTFSKTFMGVARCCKVGWKA